MVYKIVVNSPNNKEYTSELFRHVNFVPDERYM